MKKNRVVEFTRNLRNGDVVQASERDRELDRKALRRAVKHKAKVTLIRRVAKPAHASPRRAG